MKSYDLDPQNNFRDHAEYQQLLKWYTSDISPAVLKAVSLMTEEKNVGLIHDVCNIYAYGDLIKVVYIKATPNPLKALERKPAHVGTSCNTDNGKRLSNSISRAKSAIFELAMCNEFSYFCTFTQDETKRDRFNLSDFRRDLSQFVRDQNKRRPADKKIRYLMIPEHHKNGAWHMHGLLSGLGDDDLRLFTLAETLPHRIRKALKSGDKIYDWSAYRRSFGYFTASPIKSSVGVSKYITKYITKDIAVDLLDKGQHLYFASQGLARREIVGKNLYGFHPFDTWDFENDFVKVKEFRIDSNGNMIPPYGEKN